VLLLFRKSHTVSPQANPNSSPKPSTLSRGRLFTWAQGKAQRAKGKPSSCLSLLRSVTTATTGLAQNKTWLYTLLGVVGAWLLWRTRTFEAPVGASIAADHCSAPGILFNVGKSRTALRCGALSVSVGTRRDCCRFWSAPTCRRFPPRDDRTLIECVKRCQVTALPKVHSRSRRRLR